MDHIRFSRVCLRIMTMTRSLWKKRIVESTGRNRWKEFTGILHEYHVDIFLAPCNFHVESTLYQ